MRTSVKDLQATQDASCANVQPTKQALSTPLTPSLEAINDKTIAEQRPCWHNRMVRAKFTDQPQTYIVTIKGVCWDNTLRADQAIMRQQVYDAYHPFMALGKAVSEFFYGSYRASIRELHIERRIVKTRNPAHIANGC